MAKLTHHLGYKKGDPAGRGSGNHRNGSYPKTELTEDGIVEIDMPRDREGSFEPQIVPKGKTRLDGFDEKVISLFARGMTVSEIHGHLRELYAVDASPDVISRSRTPPSTRSKNGRTGLSMPFIRLSGASFFCFAGQDPR
jgi:putative transposase